MLGRTRTNHLVLLELPLSATGEYHTVILTGSTGSTFTGSVVQPSAIPAGHSRLAVL
jgi:hypothetical protein